MDLSGTEIFEKLSIVDPELTEKILARIEKKKNKVTRADLFFIEEEILQAFCQDTELGEIAAEGYSLLVGDVPEDRLAVYRDEILRGCAKGLNLGRMLARYWVPVLKYGSEDCVGRFPHLLRVLLAKGEYILKKPLDYLSLILEKKQEALSIMGLYTDVFSRNLSYKESLHLARVLPQSVQMLPEEKQNWQISQIRRIARRDISLLLPFLNALEKDLYLLSEKGLKTFVTRGMEKFDRSESLGRRYIALESGLGRDDYKELLVTVSLPKIRAQLNRYVQARTGSAVSVRPLSSLSRSCFSEEEPAPLVCSDGKSIYLSGHISEFDSLEENLEFCKCLCKLESAFYEFGTFDFDLERVRRLCGPGLHMPDEFPGYLSHPEIFFRSFPLPSLAADLFHILEQGRIRILLDHFYPGISRKAFPLLLRKAGHLKIPQTAEIPLRCLYDTISLGETWERAAEKTASLPPDCRASLAHIRKIFEEKVKPESKTEKCGQLLFSVYPETEEMLSGLLNEPLSEKNYPRLKTPWNRKLRPDLFYAAFQDVIQTARQIKVKLEEKGYPAYQNDIQKKLLEKQGNIGPEDIEEVVLRRRAEEEPDNSAAISLNADLIWPDLKNILRESGADTEIGTESSHPVFRYKEWDCHMGDYLPDYVRITDRMNTENPGDFYAETLQNNYRLVQEIRRAFEMLRPEDLTILRRWMEGDEFDYRALLDFALDRKAGITPSDRLYIKRIKQQRDVAVLLLTDLSRSTSNAVFASEYSVIDIEKQAIVLFCEALQVLGDHFAVAGFSGTGRLSVDYYRIKDFDEDVSDRVKHRISGMRPQRSTRMGAAVRHAAWELEQISARVRILIILSDGFPNDVNYKREYAIADTRKAVSEARAKNIHTRAITVNIVGDSQLDELYGSFHHNVISDVRELPDKLLRIYSSLTR